MWITFQIEFITIFADPFYKIRCLNADLKKSIWKFYVKLSIFNAGGGGGGGGGEGFT